MKKIIIIVLLFIGFVTLAQTPKERIKTLKTAYITKEISLTSDEAKVFWPIYEKYDQELENNRRKLARDILERSGSIDEMSNKEANQLILDFLKIEKALYIAEENLTENLKDVLSPQRIAKLLIAERTFNQRMLQRFRGRINQD